MPPKRSSSLSSDTSSPQAPADYYEGGWNKQVYEIDLHGVGNMPMPIYVRRTQHIDQPYDLIMTAGTPPSCNATEVLESDGVQALLSSVAYLRGEVPHIQRKRFALMFLCSIPDLPNRPVSCDSNDPTIAANVAANMNDMQVNGLVGPRTQFIPAGQAAWNVLRRANLPNDILLPGQLEGQCLPELSDIANMQSV